MTDLSIIIVSYRGWERLTKCLESLDAFAGRKISSEVIIVDNRSEDETIFRLEKRFSRFRFIHSQVNGGFAHGCNLGAGSAQGKFLLFLNPDTIAPEAELEKLLETAGKNPAITILSCRQVNEKGKESIVTGSFPQFYNLTGLQRAIIKTRITKNPGHGSSVPEDIVFADWISGSVVLIRREEFQKLNGFDDDFWMYYEDVDLCRRVWDAGGKVAFCRNITIEHNHGGSTRVNKKTESLTKSEVQISRHVYISKHKSGAERALIQIFLVINNLLTGMIMAFLGLLLFSSQRCLPGH